LAVLLLTYLIHQSRRRPAGKATTRPDSNRSRIRLGRLKAAQQRRIAGLSHSRTAHRVEAHRLSVQCSGRRVDRGSQPGLDKGSSWSRARLDDSAPIL